MADLHNLLAELDDGNDEEDTAVVHGEEEDVWDDERQIITSVAVENPEIPVVLAQAQVDRSNKIAYTNDNDDNDEEGNNHKEEKLVDELDHDLMFQDGPVSEPDEDYMKMKHLWIQEMLSPELLPYDTETISLELELLEGQEDTIDKLLMMGNNDKKTNASSSSSSSSSSHQMMALMAQIYKMDVERAKYVVSDLLATRLRKLEDYALYNRDYVNRMSDDEVSYLKSYGELLEKHFRRTVLDHMPKDAWKKLDEPDMIPSPDMDSFVFIKVIEDMVEIGQEPFGVGSCLIARYGTVQSLLLERKIELLM